MAGNGYNYGYSNGYHNVTGKANANGRNLTRFQSWGLENDRLGANEGWNHSSSFAQADEIPRDHVCRPVIVGNDGRLIPGMLECPPKYKKQAIPSDSYPRSELYGRAKDLIMDVQDVVSDYKGLKGSMFDHQKAEYKGPYGSGTYDNITSTGWTKPVTRNGVWSSSASPAAQLGKATNNIETAAEFLMESARPAATGMVHSNPWSTPSYGAEPWDTQSYSGYPPRKQSSATSFDSRVAANKYGGQFIW